MITGLATSLHFLIIIFWTIGTSSLGISTPMSPLATIIPSETWMIESILSTPSWLSILDMMWMSGALFSSSTFLISSTSEAFLTNDAAIKSIPCSIPNLISSISFSVIAGRLIETPGRFTPFLDDTFPEFATTVCMSLPLISSIFRPTRPSSIRIVSPTLTSSIIPLYDTLHLWLLPIQSSILTTNFAPSSRTTGSSNSPVLISGPLVSRRIATGWSNSSLSLFVLSILSLCSSCEPCEKLNLQTFSPFSINSFRTWSESVEGPIVQTIFVFLHLTII